MKYNCPHCEKIRFCIPSLKSAIGSLVEDIIWLKTRLDQKDIHHQPSKDEKWTIEFQIAEKEREKRILEDLISGFS